MRNISVRERRIRCAHTNIIHAENVCRYHVWQSCARKHISNCRQQSAHSSCRGRTHYVHICGCVCVRFVATGWFYINIGIFGMRVVRPSMRARIQKGYMLIRAWIRRQKQKVFRERQAFIIELRWQRVGHIDGRLRPPAYKYDAHRWAPPHVLLNAGI